MIMIIIDVFLTTRFNIGPFMAIPVKKYNDGGSVEYLGLSYKVIKYHQKQGRRDIEVCSWSIKYNIEPITVNDMDLAIEITENEDIVIKKYYKKSLRVYSTLREIDLENNKIEIGYMDDGGKYSLNIECDMVKDHVNLKNLEISKDITVIGIIDNYKVSMTKILHMNNCFAEQ